MLHFVRELLLATLVCAGLMLLIGLLAIAFGFQHTDADAVAQAFKLANLIIPTVVAGFVLAHRL